MACASRWTDLSHERSHVCLAHLAVALHTHIPTSVPSEFATRLFVAEVQQILRVFASLTDN